MIAYITSGPTTDPEVISMHTILGAGGTIGTLLLDELSGKGTPVRIVSRRAAAAPGATETRAADIADRAAAISAVAGSEVVYLLAGLKYDLRVWQELWPKIMDNTIEACTRTGAKLVFFDNVYMYGKVDGPMTEDTPFDPCSRKGEVRARIARRLLDEIGRGAITAMIVRAADFYGPNARTAVANILIFDKLAKGERALLLSTGAHPHSYTFTPDAARGVARLAQTEGAWNTTWHLPTAPDPPTGEEFVRMAAEALGVRARSMALKPWMLRLSGLFDGTIRELPEMLYQNESPYLFDSTKFRTAFGTTPTPYEQGIRLTAVACRQAGTATSGGGPR